VRGFHDLSSKFQEAAQPNDWGWTLEMHYQVHLAYAFYLAKSGRESEARQMMSAWLSRNFNGFRPEIFQRISQLFEQATKLPFTVQ
jgi:hypothetical protein